MEAAVVAVKLGAGKREAAREYGVPYSSLCNRVKNPFPSNRPGGQTVFTKFEEESFAVLLRGFESMSLPLTSSKFLQLVRKEAAKKRNFVRKFPVCVFLCENLLFHVYFELRS